jgi:uncharacterized protein (TIGR00251 family)
LTLTVRVHPRSRTQGIERISPQDYRVQVTSPPEKNEANKEVVALLAAHFGLPACRVRIIRGHKSRLKFVALELRD